MHDKPLLSVAVPWSLSHYILLDGFHPLYRALFDHTPNNIQLHAWDNVKLYKQLRRNTELRVSLLNHAERIAKQQKDLSRGSIKKNYEESFWPPNILLTRILEGEIEFHHTTPYPSLTRPFIFHCESFAPLLLPFEGQGSSNPRRNEELKDHFSGIFSDPLCLGIFSHIPETLESISAYFDNPTINAKLHASRIGLSRKALGDVSENAGRDLSKPRFLFVICANQNPAVFFERGGHIVLRFWKAFVENKRDGLLMIVCARPNDEGLLEHGVDTDFLRREGGNSIHWAQDLHPNHEINSLIQSSHFFVLPSASLHSASILQAMSLGSIPVVTDIVGTSAYITDEEHGIVLTGMREAIWHRNPDTGILMSQYCKTPNLDNSLVRQVTSRILSLLDTPNAYAEMRSRTLAHVSDCFSGPAFSADFWTKVSELYADYKSNSASSHTMTSDLDISLTTCTLTGEDWNRTFDGATQPLVKLFTGRSIVTELGGSIILASGDTTWKLSDWSVLAQFFDHKAPRTVYANNISELGGQYLATSAAIVESARIRKLVRTISRLLTPFPRLHSWAAAILKTFRRYHVYYHRYRNFQAFHSGKPGTSSDLHVATGVAGFNVIRYFHKYYAIPQDEGAFSFQRVMNGGYSSSYSGSSLDRVVRKITSKHVIERHK